MELQVDSREDKEVLQMFCVGLVLVGGYACWLLVRLGFVKFE